MSVDISTQFTRPNHNLGLEMQAIMPPSDESRYFAKPYKFTYVGWWEPVFLQRQAQDHVASYRAISIET